VNEWNQKALRASAGSVFRVPVVAITAEELVALKSRGVRLLAAVAPNSEATRKARVVLPSTETDLACACALMIGNEGAGLGDEFLALADAHITIPTPGRVESLNAAVAGSLLLYEASRQREAAQLTTYHLPLTTVL
jgi:TrmH family RNA methyltransferase